ncbi:MATE family efflux transporter [Thermovenabulum gondwanense]|uniref:Probable multidrug resistance protein NorM n=1 Tax=Thermovenabulum gondwanense TaxID=520767 RepID=A0A162MVS0_9FIRM|nr:MATE family efflux transporter [Thermovenabulum gondwanense]KYO67846.1 Multidrug resistance protein MdtK [Thermovenabulum gondwanense]
MQTTAKRNEIKLLRKEILRLAWPTILEMLSGTVIWVVDTAMVGHLSAEALSAVGLGSHLAYSSAFIFGALGVGTTAMVSRFIGSKEIEKANFITGQSFIISALLGFAVFLINFTFAQNLILLFTRDIKVVELGTVYLKIASAGAAFYIAAMVLNSALRGAGNTIIPMYSVAIANIVNIAGDYLLIFGNFGFPRWEVKGAAVATAVAQVLCFLITAFYLFYGKGNLKMKLKYIKKLDIEIIKKLVILSIPASLEEISFNVSRLISTQWLNRLGTLSYAAHQVSVSAESISFMPGYAFSVAASTVVGQSLGAKDEKRAEKGSIEATKLAAILMSMVGIAFFLIPDKIINFFTDIPQVESLSTVCIKIAAFEQTTIAISMTLSGALKGAGNTQGPFSVVLISTWLIRLPLIFLVIFVFKKGLEYVWISTVVQYFFEALLMYALFKKGEWKKIKL